MTACFSPDELTLSTGGRWLGAPPTRLEGVSTDTRTLTPGSLFVALRGERFDAHDYLGEAAARGAAAAVVAEARAGDPSPLPRLAVRDPQSALGALARLHRGRFSLPVAAVTGSNGKTTTREMLAAILAQGGQGLKTEGNLNNEVGVPLTLLGLSEAHRWAVVEMGMNHPGEIARLAAIALPQVGLVTMAAPAHLEGLGSVEAVADAKAELYYGLPAGGVAVANADDLRMLKRAEASGRRLLTFASGPERRGDVVVLEIASQGVDGLRFSLGIGNRELAIHIPGLVGAHNAANAAAAAAGAVAMGCTDKQIVRGLSEVRPVGRRLRLETLQNGLFLIDDCYNANPASMSAALVTLSDLAGHGRAAAVLGDMLELGPFEEEAHRALGEEAARRGVKLLATFGPRSRLTAEAARARGLAAFHTEDLEALIAWAKAELSPGDVLLVKGSRGMRLERLVEGLGR